ncbi:A24 family peptidase [Marinomonas atlantica]|uniref:A24 family peptidase n=1 Tax=Marinomonas atlantica TaxID=1806668 RepID=UPI0009EEED3F|nr:prepilin peptidase [Marinomonas atlantica]
MDSALLAFAGVFICLTCIAWDDMRSRQVRHRYLLCLTFLLIFTWIDQPNWSILPYSLVILLVGFVLHLIRILGAGDTKLLFVISLGVTPQFLSLFLYGTVLLGGIVASLYLLYGYCTDLSKVRKKGIPYAVPISLSGGAAILFSYLS